MEIIEVTAGNIGSEHICCAIAERKGENCVGSKKSWMKKLFKKGLVFKKLAEHGKVFIEYIPAEYAFCPIDAPGYIFINCLWVSGKFKKQGYARELLRQCADDTRQQGKSGIVALGTKKKIPFLTDPSFLKYKGFEVCDTLDPFFELLYLPFDSKVEKPVFRKHLKLAYKPAERVSIFFSNGCPYTDKYIPLQENILRERGVDYRIYHLKNPEEAQQSPAVCSIYSIFIDGEFVSSEILTENKLRLLLDKYSL